MAANKITKTTTVCVYRPYLEELVSCEETSNIYLFMIAKRLLRLQASLAPLMMQTRIARLEAHAAAAVPSPHDLLRGGDAECMRDRADFNTRMVDLMRQLRWERPTDARSAMLEAYERHGLGADAYRHFAVVVVPPPKKRRTRAPPSVEKKGGVVVAPDDNKVVSARLEARRVRDRKRRALKRARLLAPPPDEWAERARNTPVPAIVLAPLYHHRL